MTEFVPGPRRFSSDEAYSYPDPFYVRGHVAPGLVVRAPRPPRAEPHAVTPALAKPAPQSGGFVLVRPAEWCAVERGEGRVIDHPTEFDPFDVGINPWDAVNRHADAGAPCVAVWDPGSAGFRGANRLFAAFTPEAAS